MSTNLFDVMHMVFVFVHNSFHFLRFMVMASHRGDLVHVQHEVLRGCGVSWAWGRGGNGGQWVDLRVRQGKG